MRILIAGAGMAGLSAALVLGRAGHDVVLLDRDSVFRKCNCEESLLDKREGIAHFCQPQVFWPRGRSLFKKAFPDVTNRFLKPELSSYACIAISRAKLSRPTDSRWRAPGFDQWALLQAAMREPSIRTRGGVRITGLLGRPGRLPDVTGVRTSEGQVQDLVIDAPGRTSPAFSWLQPLGAGCAANGIQSVRADLLQPVLAAEA